MLVVRGAARVSSIVGMMNDNGHPLWLALGVIALFPIAAAVEIIWAAFSSRVRAYIVRHPIAHFLWFACALFMTLLLIPAPSSPRHRQGGSTNNVVPKRGGVDAGRALCLHLLRDWPGATHRER